jgi:hypothetical protein
MKVQESYSTANNGRNLIAEKMKVAHANASQVKTTCGGQNKMNEGENVNKCVK